MNLWPFSKKSPEALDDAFELPPGVMLATDEAGPSPLVQESAEQTSLEAVGEPDVTTFDEPVMAAPAWESAPAPMQTEPIQTVSMEHQLLDILTPPATPQIVWQQESAILQESAASAPEPHPMPDWMEPSSPEAFFIDPVSESFALGEATNLADLNETTRFDEPVPLEETFEVVQEPSDIVSALPEEPIFRDEPVVLPDNIVPFPSRQNELISDLDEDTAGEAWEAPATLETIEFAEAVFEPPISESPENEPAVAEASPSDWVATASLTSDTAANDAAVFWDMDATGSEAAEPGFWETSEPQAQMDLLDALVPPVSLPEENTLYQESPDFGEFGDPAITEEAELPVPDAWLEEAIPEEEESPVETLIESESEEETSLDIKPGEWDSYDMGHYDDPDEALAPLVLGEEPEPSLQEAVSALKSADTWSTLGEGPVEPFEQATACDNSRLDLSEVQGEIVGQVWTPVSQAEEEVAQPVKTPSRQANSMVGSLHSFAQQVLWEESRSIQRSIDDLVAGYFAKSGSDPHSN